MLCTLCVFSTNGTILEGAKNTKDLERNTALILWLVDQIADCCSQAKIVSLATIPLGGSEVKQDKWGFDWKMDGTNSSVGLDTMYVKQCDCLKHYLCMATWPGHSWLLRFDCLDELRKCLKSAFLLSKIRLMVIYLCTTYFKRRITSSA
jgi:hypothetical protein